LILLPAGFLVLLAGYATGRRAASNAPARPSAPEVATGDSARARSESARRGGEELDAGKERAERMAFWNALSRRVDTEAVDSAWSQETEVTITRLIPQTLGPAVSVEETRCAATICRAKLRHPVHARIPDDDLVRFSLNRESLASMEIQLDTRSEKTTTLYFLRRVGLPEK
jgi:hypothetical protein